jgi:hypothetical protein
MEDLELDDSNWELVGNPMIAKAYTTGIAESSSHEFLETIQADMEGRTDEPARRRFFFYSDHDTGILAFAGAF